jgi:hypothetical protein
MHWLNEAINDHRLGERIILKATDTNYFLRLAKMALMTWDKQSKDIERLLRI